jgi:hypothetical protein
MNRVAILELAVVTKESENQKTPGSRTADTADSSQETYVPDPSHKTGNMLRADP